MLDKNSIAGKGEVIVLIAGKCIPSMSNKDEHKLTDELYDELFSFLNIVKVEYSNALDNEMLKLEILTTLTRLKDVFKCLPKIIYNISMKSFVAQLAEVVNKTEKELKKIK